MPNGQDHQPEPKSGLDVVSELQQRMVALEGKMQDVLDALEGFRDQGGDLDIAHVRHVMNKHFFHDKPDVETEQSRSAG